MKLLKVERRFAIISFGAFFVGSNLLFAGAWTREKNEVYSKLSLSQFESDEVYAPKKNKKLPGPDYSELTTSVYGEYGFTNSLTGILSFSHKAVESSSASVKSTESGLTDVWVYLKKGILQAPFVLSAQVGVKIPLGYDKDNIPPLGDGQVDYEARFLVGKSFHPFPGYGNAEVGYRKRNGDFSDEIPFRLEVGAFPVKGTLLKISLDGISNTSNDKASELGANLGPNVFDEEYMKLSSSLIFFNKKGYGFEIYYETLLSGANTAAGQTIGVGLSWQGKLARNEK